MAGGVQCLARPQQRPPPGIHFRATGEGVKDQDPAILRRGVHVAEDAVPKAKPGKVPALGRRELLEDEVTGEGTDDCADVHLVSTAAGVATSVSLPFRTS